MRLSCGLLGVILAVSAPWALAQPDLRIRVGQTVADQAPDGYRFERLSVASADGTRHYRVHLIIPTGSAPPSGFPVAYMLDGNAVLMELDGGLLHQQRAGGHPVVLALIAADNDLRIDGEARTFDYTPRRGSGEGEEFDAMNTARRSGGAAQFLQLIQTRIKPAVEARVAVDRQHQLLWGHSYGGLFALHVLATEPTAFSDYVAVDPSLWWGEGFVIGELEAAAKRRPTPAARLLLVQGGSSDGSAPGRKPEHAARGAGNAEAAQRLSAALQNLPSVQLQSHALPGMSHGQTLGAAIAPALQTFSR